MVAITATNSATPSLQAILSRTRLAQAQREANQAEVNAQNLRAQADEAERESHESQARVRMLSSRSRSTDPTYAAQVRANKSDNTAKPDDVLGEVDQFARQTNDQNNTALKNILNAIPVSAKPGQAKGRLVNESV